MSIEWRRFDTPYVQLETGVAKSLTLTNWQQGCCFDTPGLRFDVTEEDSRPVSKVFTTTSRQLIQALKHIIMKAEEQDSKAISVSILKISRGFSTLYEVKENA